MHFNVFERKCCLLCNECICILHCTICVWACSFGEVCCAMLQEICPQNFTNSAADDLYDCTNCVLEHLDELKVACEFSNTDELLTYKCVSTYGNVFFFSLLLGYIMFFSPDVQ